MSVSLLDLLASRGLQPKKVSSGTAGRGEEYASPCPVCGGKDRFRIWPQQEGGTACVSAGVRGTWYCRKEGNGGDVLEYLLAMERMSWSEACKRLSIENVPSVAGKLPQLPKSRQVSRSSLRQSFRPRESQRSTEAWSIQAAKLVERAHNALLAMPRALTYLKERGLNEEAVCRYKLGCLSGENGRQGIFRARSAFGLAPKQTPEGKTRASLFIPRGITIPAYTALGHELVRVRIRRPDVDVAAWGDKYMLLEGGCGKTTTLFHSSEEQPTVVVVVEAELDAMLVHHLVGDMVASLAVLTNRGRPDASAHKILRQAPCILVALDYDAAGADGWAWWEAVYPQARRWPVPSGKDPGDAYKRGESLREWVIAGIPPAVYASYKANANNHKPLCVLEENCPKTPELIELEAFHELWKRVPLSFTLSPQGQAVWNATKAVCNAEERRMLFQRVERSPVVWGAILAHEADCVTADNFMQSPMVRALQGEVFRF